jgi:histidinol phosphatase-like PHP family hydrolase
VPLTNGDIAELLWRASETADTDRRKRALRRAAYAAIWQWTEEAADLRERGKRFTELRLVGPWIAQFLDGWFADDVGPPDRPPIRAGFLTLTEVRATLARHPEWRAGYCGDLQVHTTWSDGAGTPLEMATAAAGRGYAYVAFTDHTKGLPIAGGMNEESVRRQWAELKEVGRQMRRGFTILRSLEMNLSLTGEGDMDPALLEELDLLVAAFHSKLRVTTDETARYLRAVANPHMNVLAHPRNRRYGVRLGLVADWAAIARAAAERDLALEIDSWPDRQDLDVASLHAVAEAGGRVAIDTDAHSVDELAFVDFGLAAAVRAGIRRDRVINFLPVDDLRAWAKESSQMARRSWAGASVSSSRGRDGAGVRSSSKP